MRRSSSPAVLLLVIAACSWGISAALSKLALEQLAPLDLFAVEVAIGALVLSAIALARGARPSRPSAVVMLLGVLEPGLSFVLFDVGLTHTAATHGALLFSTESLFIAGLASVLLGERLDARLRLALAAGVAGSVLVSLHGGGTASSPLGDLLIVASALVAAGYGVLARHVMPGRDALSLTAVQMITAAAVGLPVAALAAGAGQSRLADADGGHLLVALAAGVLASVIPFVLYNSAIDRITATAAGLVLTLIPLFGTLASLLLLGERLGLVQWIGGALIIVAAALAGTGGASATSAAGEARAPAS